VVGSGRAERWTDCRTIFPTMVDAAMVIEKVTSTRIVRTR
jgi:hypothetical protein